MNSMRDRQITMEQLRSWPLYASLRDWSNILGYSRDNLRQARRLGYLTGSTQGGGQVYFTRTQILKWIAPGLLMQKEDLVSRLIEPGKDIA